MPAWPPYSSRTTAIWKPSSRSSASSGSSRSESGTTIGLTIRCLMRVVGALVDRQRHGVLDVHGADDGVLVVEHREARVAGLAGQLDDRAGPVARLEADWCAPAAS